MSNYRTSVHVGYDDTGKKVTKTVRANTKKELRQKVAALIAERDKGKDIHSKAEFSTWADKWFEEIKKPSDIKAGTLKEYDHLMKHLKEEFGGTDIRDISFSDFQQFINRLAENNPNTGKPASKQTLKVIKSIAEGVFSYAAANNVSAVNMFFKSVVIPKSATANKRRALTEEELSWIVNTVHRAQTAALIMCFAGLRRGELFALQWSDIDFNNKTIIIDKSADYDTGGIKQGGKTYSATRTVPLPPILLKHLKELSLTQKFSSKFICPQRNGKMMTPSAFKSMWNSYLVDLNVKYGYANQNVSKYDPKGLPMKIEKFTAHYLRHTYATLLFLQGIDVMTAKQYLGHSDIKMTANIYTDMQHNSRFTLSEEYKNHLDTDYKIPA